MSNASRITTRPARRDTLTFPFDPSDMDRANELANARTDATQDVERARYSVTSATAALEAAQGDDDRAALVAGVSVAQTNLTVRLETLEKAKADLASFMGSIPILTLRLKSCGSKKCKKIELANPATAEQVAEHEAEYGPAAGKLVLLNKETFPAAILHACCEAIEVTGQEPVLAPNRGEVEALLDGDGWSEGDLETIAVTCQRLCTASTALRADVLEQLGKG